MSNIDEFAPEVREAEKDEKKKARKEIEAPTHAGTFEKKAVHSMGELAKPLALPPKLLRERALGRYQNEYNAYVPPLRSTMRAMGRLEDVIMTGAPLTPDKMSPKLAKRFKKLSLSAQEDTSAGQAMDTWSTAQTTMLRNANDLAAKQTLLRGAVHGFYEIKALIARRQAEAKRDGKIGELAGIEHSAEVCARIVEVGAEAVTGAAEIDEALSAGIELDEGAEMEEGATAWRDGQQKAGDAVEAVAGGISKGRAVAAQLKKYALAGQGIEMKDIFIIVQGHAGRYMQLEKDIAKLSELIGNLQYTEEEQKIAAAKDMLKGFTLELASHQMGMRADRSAARRGAQGFAQAAAGGKDALYAMYAAEAYQELDTFATITVNQRESSVDPAKAAAARFVETKWEWFEGENFVAEALELRDNLVMVSQQQVYFDEHVPEWQKNAAAWRTFLEKKTQKPLLDGQSEVDEESGV